MHRGRGRIAMRGTNDGDVYVQPNRRGGWDVVKEKGQRASASVPKKSDAIAYARRLVRSQGAGKLRLRF
jgi:hypothetical protein